MKILLVNKYWHTRGGAERVLFATKELLEKAGHTVEAFGMKHPDNTVSNDYFIDEIDYGKIKGFGRIGAGLKSIYNFDAKKKFKRLIQDFQPDIVHFHNIYHQLSFSLFDAVKESGIPSVMTLHDYKMISPNYNLFHHGRIDESCIKGNYFNCLAKNCMENFSFSLMATAEAYIRKWKKWKDCVGMYICPSEFLKQKFMEAGWYEKKLRAIAYPRMEPKTTITAGKNSDVVFFGRLSKEKGLDVLLEAAKKTPEINYKIIGAGPLRDEIKDKIIGENIKNIKLLGYKNGDELWTEVASACLAVVPSIWYETGGPMTTAEALSLGTAVVGTNIGSIPEVLPEDLLFPTGDSDALVRRIRDWSAKPASEKDDVVSELQRKIKEKYDPKKYLNKLVDLYQNVILLPT